MEKLRLSYEDAEGLDHGSCPYCDLETQLVRVGPNGFHCRSCDAVFKLDDDGYYYELK